jgi:hypothetical protein
MKKIKGDEIRAYQGGEPIGKEFNVYFCEHLQFIAVECFYNDVSSSKMVEVKQGDKVLYSGTFDHCKKIHAAKVNELATSLFIFHNGNNDNVGGRFNDVIDYIRFEQEKANGNRLNVVIDKIKKLNTDMEKFDLRKEHIELQECYEEKVKRLYSLEYKINSIPLWIRKLFKAD